MESTELFTGEWISGIRFEPLVALLMRWEPWFLQHGVNLKRHRPVWEKKRHIAIHDVFLKNWPTVPKDLGHALLDIVEMSTAEGHNILTELAPEHGWQLGKAGLSGWSCQDLAARAYVENHNLFELARAALVVRETENWIEFFDPEQGDLAERITDTANAKLIEAIRRHWHSRHRGRYIKLEVITVDGAPTFLIAHADLLRSQTNIREVDSVREIVRFHPELVDLVRYHQETGRLSVHTRWPIDAKAYRRLFGDVFWGDVGRYQVRPVYSGDPLMQQGAAVLQHAAEALFTVRVKEVELFQPSNPRHWCHLRGANGGNILDNDLKQAKQMGLVGVKSLKMGFKFAGEHQEIPVSLKEFNQIRMPYTLGHTDAIFRFLMSKGFMKLPKAQRTQEAA